MSSRKLRLVQAAGKPSPAPEAESANAGEQAVSDYRVNGVVCERLQYVEWLFTKYQKALLSYLSRLLRNDEDASDLLQETYERVLRQPSLDHLETNARAYLYKVATNLVRDRVRQERVRQRDQHQSLEEGELESRQPSPYAQVEWIKAMDLLKEVIHELPPRCRQIFILHRMKHLSYPEIADVMDVSTRTVERNMSLALAHCKSKLREVL